MKDRELLQFLTGSEAPPALVKAQAKADVLLSFRGTQIVFKFFLFELLGALFSMAVCPQFGLGLVEGHGLAHSFRAFGDGACAAFCASLFLSSGLVVAFIGMPGEELWWVWRRFKYTLVLLPPLLWGLFMLTNLAAGIPRETLTYNLSWVLAGVAAQVLWLELRSKSFVRDLAARTTS